MLQHVHSDYSRPQSDRGADPKSAAIDLTEALAILRRRLGLLALMSLLALGAAYVYGLVVEPRYVATTQILIDPRDLQVFEREVTPRSLSTDNGATIVESQARVVSSDNVLLKAIKSLGLDGDPEFGGAQPPLPNTVLGRLRGLLRPAADTGAGDGTLAALRALKKQLVVKRGEKSFVVDVSVYSASADKAATIANAIATAYLIEQGDSRSDSARMAGDAIEGRLAELKRRVGEDEAKVAKYRNARNLVLASGRFVNEQQLTDMNNQLGGAQAETAKAKARIEEIDASKGSPENLPEAVRSETLRILRGQHANVVRERARLASQFKPAHPRMLDIVSQEQQSNKQITDEIGRILESARLDYRRAQASEKSLRDSLERSRKLMNETSDNQVDLRELERNLEASRVIYSAFLVRAREAKEQEQLNTTNARVISVATPSLDKLWPPRKVLLMPLALLGGLGAGSALAFMLEANRRRRELSVPRRPARTMVVERPFEPSRTALVESSANASLRALPQPIAFADLRGAPNAGDGTMHLALTRIEQPSAPAARQLDQLYLSLRRLDRDGHPRCVLIVADRPGPMKSSVALGLAVAGGLAGDRILLIGADPLPGGVSATLGTEARHGLDDVLSGTVPLADAVLTYQETGIEILASLRGAGIEGGLLGEPEAFARLLAAANGYEMIIIDGQPLAPRQSPQTAAVSVDDVLVVLGHGPSGDGDHATTLPQTIRNTPKVRGFVLVD